jgi:hypothetical protein
MPRRGSTPNQRTRDIVFLVVGATTPIGILAVNGAAFVMQHLYQFRLAIAICALISGLSLNGVTAKMVMDRVRRYLPRLFTEFGLWVNVVAAVCVSGFAVFGAWGTYQSMQSPKDLPNIWAVLTAVWLLFWPWLMMFISRRIKVAGMRREAARPSAVVPPPPWTPPATRERESGTGSPPFPASH